MNFTLPALLVVLISTPGILLYVTFQRRRFNDLFKPASITSTIFIGLLLSLLLHPMWLFLAGFFGYTVRFDVLLRLISPVGSSTALDHAINIAASNLAPVLLYTFTLYIASILLGFHLFTGVRRFKLDHKYEFLRVLNDWYYLFSGEDFLRAHKDDIASPKRLPDGTFVHAIVDQASIAYIYTGVLRDYSLDQAGQLRSIILAVSRRRRLIDDPPPTNRPTCTTGPTGTNESRYYNIPVDYLTIRSEHIKTLSVSYFWLELASDEDDEQLTECDTKKEESP